MSKFKQIVLFLYLVPWSLFLSPPSAHAQTRKWSLIEPSLGQNVVCVDFGSVATLQGFGCLFVNLLSIAVQGLGLVMFIMLLIGGLKYLTAGDDPKAVEAAKGTLTSAVVGLVMAILGWFILVLIGQFTGLNLTQFTFGL